MAVAANISCWPEAVDAGRAEHVRSAPVFQTSICSAIDRASSTSIPRTKQELYSAQVACALVDQSCFRPSERMGAEEGLGAGFAKPDLLVHQPGHMASNYAVIEVKHARAARAGLRKDLGTLSLFVNKVQYQRAILLVYGDEANEDMVDAILRLAASVEYVAPIELWLHQAVGHSANHIRTVQQPKKLSRRTKL